jgi:hypothetical protein
MEMKYVLQEFLQGTNDLTINARDEFFENGTKIGGILTGGSVYLELVKKIVEKYGKDSPVLDTFVIAVDKENKKAVFETSESDAETKNVIITDDIIDKGGTVLTALWAAGEHFPKATIRSGKGTDYPGGFEERRIDKHLGYLSSLFQDYADFEELGQSDKALALFDQAEQYAKENRVELQAGWFKKKKRIEEKMKK